METLCREGKIKIIEEEIHSIDERIKKNNIDNTVLNILHEALKTQWTILINEDKG